MSATANFDGLVRIYRALELVAFGRDLERTRFSLLGELRDCRRILVLGEGDGRCLVRLLAAAPAARIVCVDASPAMLAAAAQRLSAAERDRVSFTCADIFAFTAPDGSFDAIVTLFFLDCFSTAQVEDLVARGSRWLAPDARWLFGDFIVPPRGLRRWRAQAWLAMLYAFFRWQTGLRTRRLPDSERVLEHAGFSPTVTREFQRGLLRATLYRRAAAIAG